MKLQLIKIKFCGFLSSTGDGTMKPSGDFVVMEAKELVKLFEADGNPKKGTVLQPMAVANSFQVLLE